MRAARVGAASGDLFRGFMLRYLGVPPGRRFDEAGPAPDLGLTGIQVACVAGLLYYMRDCTPRLRRPQGRSPMADRERPYLFYDVAISICSTCFRKVDAKIVFQDGAVYMRKRCPEHGFEKVLIADDVDYYRRCREVFLKTPEMPHRLQHADEWGCPYDCGLCPDHEQHSCLTLVEITDHCNLAARSATRRAAPRGPASARSPRSSGMLDAVVAQRGRARRRPDLRRRADAAPRFFAILDAAKARPIRHLMVNTNGVRIAQDEPSSRGGSPDYMPGLRGVPAVRLARARAAPGAARRRPARGARARDRAR